MGEGNHGIAALAKLSGLMLLTNWCQNKGIFSLPKDKFEKVEFP